MAAPALTAHGLLLGAARPADGLRRWLLRRLGRWGLSLWGRRELRVAVAGTGIVASALLLTLLAPLWLLAWGPILYGVPHLLADVRYLVVRPGHHRRRWLWLWCGLPLCAAALGAGAPAGLLAVAGAAACARAGRAGRGALGALALCLALGCLRAGALADLLLAHLHNVLAVVLWWAWRPRTGRLHLLPLLLFAAASALILLGGVDSWPGPGGPAAAGHGWAPAGLDLAYHLDWLAPGVASPLAGRLVLCFAFAQAVHYGVWVRLIPEEDRPRPAPRGFASSLRALQADFGPRPLLAVACCAAGLVAWALWDLQGARTGYLRLALFHGPLELCAATLLFLEGRRRA